MRRLSPVECSIELMGDSTAASLGAGWRVLRADVAQRIDHPWLAIVTLVTDVVDTRAEELLGRPAVLTWERPGLDAGPQILRGLVTRAEYVGTFDRQLHARVRIEPALALLRHGRRRRIFEERKPAQIAGEVLHDVFTAHAATLFDDTLVRAHDRRDHAVQYDETDLEFLRRILAEAGIAFVFDPSAEVDHVRLVDHNDGFIAVGGGRHPNELPSPPEIRVISSRPEEAPEESVQSFSASHEVTTARVTSSGWDFKHRDPTRLRSSAATGARAAVGEWLEHAGARLVELDHGDGATDDATPWMAQLAAERAALDAVELGGRGNVTLFAAGTVFMLADHPHEDLDAAPYLLTRVTHRLEVPSAAVSGEGRASTYHNEFSCVPLKHPYRPARIAAPRVHGPETAIVVGPRHEDVYTDRHARVHVQLHWDDRDTDSCRCWLRVSQAWAGLGFGTLFLPRVGMEVIVSFLGGNPDRPIVTGCVYNALNVPPVELPDHKTQSTIRTSSSPGDRGHNELRFEDAAGREEVYLRAQRNLREWVGADHGTTVGRDQTLHVGRDQRVTIAGDRKSVIEGEHHHTVEAHERYHVKGTRTVGVEESGHIHFGENIEVYVNEAKEREAEPPKRVDGAKVHVGGDAHVEATRSQTLLCGGSRVVMDTRSIDISAAESISLTVGESSLVLTPDGITIRGSSIVAAARGAVETARLALTRDRAALTSPKVALIKGKRGFAKLDGDATINGTRVIVNGVDSMELGASSVVVAGEAALAFQARTLEWLGDLVTIDPGATLEALDKIRATVEAALASSD
jgi:type VI secretion system secreted protein VgrG